MNLEKQTLPNKIDLKRKVPVEFDYKKVDNITFFLEIPSGYETNFIPSNTSFDGKYFKYSINYKKVNGSIQYTLFLEQKTMFLEPEEFKKYNDELEDLHVKFRESAIFRK